MDPQTHNDIDIARAGQKQLRKLADRYIGGSVILVTAWLIYAVWTITLTTKWDVNLVLPFIMSIVVVILLVQAHSNRRRILQFKRALDLYIVEKLKNKDCNATTSKTKEE